MVHLPSCLYADNLVFMSPTMEQFGRASPIDKGRKVNAGMSKVMVGSCGGKMIVNSGKWAGVVREKRVQTNLLSALYAKGGFTGGAVVYMMTCR